MVDMKSSNEMHKSLLPSMILKTEKMAKKVMKVLKEEYVNPFGAELDKQELYNLSSGVPLPGDISDQILAIRDAGKTAFTAFVEERLVDKSVPFHDSISRRKLQLFSTTSEKVEIKSKFSACPRAFYVGVPSCPRALVPSCPNFWRALAPKFSACPRAFDVDVQDTLEGFDP